MMIAKAIWQNQTKHSGFTEFYRYSAEEMQRQILPETENLPFFAKKPWCSCKKHRKTPDFLTKLYPV
jgi:hypothetical protein